MSLWHLSPPLSASVNSSDLFTFTPVFQRTELAMAQDWFGFLEALAEEVLQRCLLNTMFCLVKFFLPGSSICFKSLVIYMYYCIFIVLFERASSFLPWAWGCTTVFKVPLLTSVPPPLSGGGVANAISRWRFHQGPSVVRGGSDRKGLTLEHAV